jgi:hypothetical protein
MADISDLWSGSRNRLGRGELAADANGSAFEEDDDSDADGALEAQESAKQLLKNGDITEQQYQKFLTNFKKCRRASRMDAAMGGNMVPGTDTVTADNNLNGGGMSPGSSESVAANTDSLSPQQLDQDEEDDDSWGFRRASENFMGVFGEEENEQQQANTSLEAVKEDEDDWGFRRMSSMFDSEEGAEEQQHQQAKPSSEEDTWDFFGASS